MLPIGLLPRSGPWEHVASTTLTAAAASITLPVLPVYRALWVEVYMINDANDKSVNITLNGDTGTNYSRQHITAESTNLSGARQTGAANWGVTVGENENASEEMQLDILIVKPSAAVKAQALCQRNSQFATANAIGLSLLGFEWDNTTALITSIALNAASNNFAIGTTVKVYGSRRMDA